MKKEAFERAKELIIEKERIEGNLRFINKEIEALKEPKKFLDIAVNGINISCGKYEEERLYLNGYTSEISELFDYGLKQSNLFLTDIKDILIRRKEQIDKKFAEL